MKIAKRVGGVLLLAVVALILGCLLTPKATKTNQPSPSSEESSPLAVVASTKNARDQPLSNTVIDVMDSHSTSTQGGITTQAQPATKVQGIFKAIKSMVVPDLDLCTSPVDGPALRAAAGDTACPIITLLPGVVYDTGDKEIIISTHKVIIGHPINLPTLDGSNSRRLFRVVRGGFLELKFVKCYRGGGEVINTIPVIKGGSILVELGGTTVLFGCLFTNAPPNQPIVLVSPDTSRAVRIFGGQLFVAGGTAMITNCHFFTLAPGVLIREFYAIGGQVLLGAGTLIITASTLTNTQAFVNGFGAGLFLAQLGGVMIQTAVVYLFNGLVVQASGVGIIVFLGAGVGIFTACTFNANIAVIAHFGAGVYIFQGAGVTVLTGCAFDSTLSISILCGIGAMFAVGAGSLTMVGCTFAFEGAISFVAETGIFAYLGTGSAVLIGVSKVRLLGVAGIYGSGGSIFNGGGVSVMVGFASADAYGVASIGAVGGDFFVGAGELVDIGAYTTKNIGVGFVALPGIRGFVGGGSAVVVGGKLDISLGEVYATQGSYPYIVNGDTSVPPGLKIGRLLSGSSSQIQFIDPIPPSHSSILDYVAWVSQDSQCRVCGLAQDQQANFTGKGSSQCSFNDTCGTEMLPHAARAAMNDTSLKFPTVHILIFRIGTTEPRDVISSAIDTQLNEICPVNVNVAEHGSKQVNGLDVDGGEQDGGYDLGVTTFSESCAKKIASWRDGTLIVTPIASYSVPYQQGHTSSPLGSTPAIVILQDTYTPIPSAALGSTIYISLLNFKQGATIRLDLATVRTSQVIYDKVLITNQDMKLPITIQHVTSGDYFIKASPGAVLSTLLRIVDA